MAHLRHRHASICRQWFEQLQPLELDSGVLEVHTSNGVQQNYLQRKCLAPFTEAAQIATGALVTVRFVTGDVPPQPATTQTPRLMGIPDHKPTTAPPTIRERSSNRSIHSDHLLDQIVISPDYTFDNFVTGPENHLAYAAAVAVANQPGVAYNPLFIHGGVGLGKTHLLQATSQAIIQANPNVRICYLSCDVFMNQFLDCVQSGQMSQFRDHYRHVDMLVIDDIHFLANRERTQEEFFHTFNALYQLKQQIILSSDSPPSEIPQLEERLVSRFQWGLVAAVSRPCYETRVAIVRAKAKLRGLDMPDEVIDYIATRIDSNARELEGTITTIQGHSALHGRPIDLAMAHDALGETAKRPITSQVTLENIIDAVTQFYNVKLSDLQSKRRHKSITGPRQVCMWLARKQTRFSLEEIGGYFGGRDHTTVMHSIKTVDQRISQDSEFSGQLEHLEVQINKR